MFLRRSVWTAFAGCGPPAVRSSDNPSVLTGVTSSARRTLWCIPRRSWPSSRPTRSAKPRSPTPR